MNRKEDLQQFFISANSAQNRHDFDLDDFTEQYLQRNPRSFSEYKEQCNTPIVGNSAYLCKNVKSLPQDPIENKNTMILLVGKLILDFGVISYNNCMYRIFKK